MNKLLVAVLLISNSVFAQDIYTISGHFPNFPKSTFELKGYEGFQENVLFKTSSDTAGRFTLTYPADYVGFARLDMNGAYSNLLFLNKENFSLFWEDLTNREGLQISGSQEYDAFIQGMKTFQEAEAKLAGWHYLLPLYTKDSLQQNQIASELDRVNNLFPSYVKSLPEDVWVRQYLLTKGLIEQMPNSVKTYPWRAPQHVPEFMAIDFKALKHSGLYKDLLEGYTSLVERFPLEEINLLLIDAIDKVLTELKEEPSIQQTSAQQWFTLLESKSLFAAAEHLALAMLNQKDTVLNTKSLSLFKKYEALAVGNTAPDIQLTNTKTLSDIQKNTLLIFGSAECGPCMDAKNQLEDYYPKWKVKGDIEVVYISIDTDKTLYQEVFSNTPWQTYCDFKGYDTQAAKDYFVNATPTYVLLDKNLKIAVHPKSLVQVDFWVNHQLSN